MLIVMSVCVLEHNYKITIFSNPPVTQYDVSVTLWCDSATDAHP